MIPVRAFAQVLVGILLVVAIGSLIQLLRSRAEIRRLPPGWQILRPPSEVTALLSDDSSLWAGGRDGITLIDRKSGQRLPPLPGMPAFDRVNGLLKDGQGAIWIAHETTEWIWLTNLQTSMASTASLVHLGHARWDIENYGFNELVNGWHAAMAPNLPIFDGLRGIDADQPIHMHLIWIILFGGL